MTLFQYAMTLIHMNDKVTKTQTKTQTKTKQKQKTQIKTQKQNNNKKCFSNFVVFIIE